MGDRSGIEWTDATWNPVTGCDQVSQGCDNCYAETIAHRFAGTKAYPDGFEVTLRPERLDQPLRWRNPRRVFVNSMSDLFHDGIPDEYIARVFAVMALAPTHTFQILTKRPGRMRSLLKRQDFSQRVVEAAREWDGPSDDCPAAQASFCEACEEGRPHVPDQFASGEHPLPNVWLGVSVEDQRWADIRIPALLETPAAVRFLSCEPLLGPVDLGAWLPYAACVQWDGEPTGADQDALKEIVNAVGRMHGLGWVIVGGESGPNARPMHPDWARSLRDQCVSAGVPYLLKQWGEWSPLHQSMDYVTNDNRCQVVHPSGRLAGRPWLGWNAQHPNSEVMRRYGKKAAGRELDGRTWDEFPEAVHG